MLKMVSKWFKKRAPRTVKYIFLGMDIWVTTLTALDPEDKSKVRIYRPRIFLMATEERQARLRKGHAAGEGGGEAQHPWLGDRHVAEMDA